MLCFVQPPEPNAYFLGSNWWTILKRKMFSEIVIEKAWFLQDHQHIGQRYAPLPWFLGKSEGFPRSEINHEKQNPTSKVILTLIIMGLSQKRLDQSRLPWIFVLCQYILTCNQGFEIQKCLFFIFFKATPHWTLARI